MKRTFLALALAVAAPSGAMAAGANTAPGYTPPTIQAPPQFNGGATTTAPPAAAPSVTSPSPVVAPRARGRGR